MKQNKNTLYNNQILKCLMTGDTFTTQQIADNVGLSEKTVRTRINQLNDWLVEQGLGRIERKQGTGIWLELEEGQKMQLSGWLQTSDDLPASTGFDNRNKQLIGKLLKLKPGETTTLQQLADSLYLSPPTVGGLLKVVADWFEERHLKVTSIRSKGICLEGDEYNLRIAIRDYMMEMMPEVLEALLGTFAPGVDVARIRQIVVEAENAWRIELADRSFKMENARLTRGLLFPQRRISSIIMNIPLPSPSISGLRKSIRSKLLRRISAFWRFCCSAQRN